MNHLAIWFGRHRGVVAVCVLVFTGVSLFGASRVTFDNDPYNLFKSEHLKLKQLDPEFAHLERTCVIVIELDDLIRPEAATERSEGRSADTPRNSRGNATLMTPRAVRALGDIVNGAAAIEGVEAVYSMLDVRGDLRIGRYFLPFLPSPRASEARFARARAAAAGHPLLIGQFLSADMRTTLVFVQFDAGVRGIAEVKPVLDQLQGVLRGSTDRTGLRARITGTSPLLVEIIENMRRDIFVLCSLGAALVVLIAFIIFRRIGAVLMVAIGPGMGTIWTVGVLGLIGQPINMLTNVVPLLVLVIGFTDSVHLVLHVRRSLAAGSSSMDAAKDAIRYLGLPCALTSLSTAVGFASLTVADLHGIRCFGQCCALGTVLSFCAVLTTVPLLASSPLSKYAVAPAGPRKRSPLTFFSERILGGIVGHPRVVTACGAALMLALAVFATKLEPDHRIATEIPHSSEAYEALEHIDEAFGGVMFAYVLVQWPEQHGLRSPEFYEVLEEVHAVLDASRVLSNPLSVLNLVSSLPGSDQGLAHRARQLRYVPQAVVRRLVNSAQRRAVVSAHMPDVGARVLTPAFDDVERQLAEVEQRHPEFRVQLTGSSVAVFRSMHLMIADLWKSLTTAAGVMFLMIWLGLRSLRYALISIMPNLFPLLCTASFIVLSGRCLEMTSVIVFSISLGIAVDDTIHFLVRYRREVDAEQDSSGAVRRTFTAVGAALVITTVALVAGHTIVMLSGFPAIQVFGMLTCVTLASALVGDLLILPALLVCFAKGKPPKKGSRPTGP